MLQKGLAYDNTSSVTINFYKKFCDVQQKKTYSISYLQINNFDWENFLKITEHTQIEANESATIDTPDNVVDAEKIIYNTKVVSVYQKVLATTHNCSDYSNDVTPYHEDLLDCTCRLMSAKDYCITNG